MKLLIVEDEAEVALTIHLTAPVLVAAPNTLVNILVSNLPTNTFCHNHPSGTILVHLTATALRVENIGRPRPRPADQEFGRFRKQADSAPGGVGLGLAIAHQIAETCGFDLCYAYPDAGRHALTVTFLLPRVPERLAHV